MTRITITIDVAGEVTLTTPSEAAKPPFQGSSGPPASNEPILVLDEAPWPGGPNGKVLSQTAGGMCPVHGQPWKTVPAGVSKSTGKPYTAFRACPERGCHERPTSGNGIGGPT